MTNIRKLSVYLSLYRVNSTPLLTGAVAFLKLGLGRLLINMAPITQAIFVGPATAAFVVTFVTLAIFTDRGGTLL